MAERIIGIMGAMQEEIDGVAAMMSDVQIVNHGMRTYYSGKLQNTKVVLVFSRWGKVAAATTVTNLILEFKITELIFTGVAGAIHHDLKIGDVVIAKRLIQHDMDARPLMPQFEIPLLGKTYFETRSAQLDAATEAVNFVLENKKLHELISQKDLDAFNIIQPKLQIGDIASGDKFFSSSGDKDALLSILPEVLCVEMEGAAVAQVCYEYEIPFTIIRTISDTADEQSPVDFLAFVREVACRYSGAFLTQLAD